ncbi:MAG: hypothetical protein R3B99_14990 [Polyangiales bacterium]
MPLGDSSRVRLALIARCQAAELGAHAWNEEDERLSASVDADTSAAYVLALRALRRFSHDEPFAADARPSARFRDASPLARELACVAMTCLTRRLVLAFDAEALASALAVHATLVDDPSGRSAAGLTAGHAWSALMRGDADEARRLAGGLHALSREHALAAERIEAKVLDALAAVETGTLDEAVSHARVASRMARTEALPQSEYLANLVLARLRRLSGKPHLAARILSAPFASRPVLAWMRLELLSPGASDAIFDRTRTVPRPTCSARSPKRWSWRARGRSRRSWRRCAMRAWRRRPSPTCVATSRSSGLVDRLTSVGSDAGVSKRRGRRRAARFGLCRGDAKLEPGEVAFVVTSGETTRVLAPGEAFAGPEVLRVGKAPGRQARTDAAIAALLLAGDEGLHEDGLFERLYGFKFQKDLHRGVRDVLFHRVRQRLVGVGRWCESDRTRGAGPPRSRGRRDPRRGAAPRPSWLFVLASAGHASAREAAEALGIPIRTAQDALRRLADDGACRAIKRGKVLEYHLEDTTFLEPTQA